MQTLEQANNYAALYWLAFLLTGDRGRSLDVTLETLDSRDSADSFFSGWMLAWSRKVAIAKALAGIRDSLVASARRTASQRAEQTALPSREWVLDPDTPSVELESAVLAIDVFPRCALLLTLFEGVSAEDAAVLLDEDGELVRKAQIIGLRDLTRNLARVQGWTSTAGPRSRIRQAHIPSSRSALLPLIVMLAIPVPGRVRAADALIMDSANLGAMAFARYTAGLAQTKPWSLETMEIEASLPEMKKQGRLRAIRRLLPLGKPEYQVLEIAGDQTVRQQVIVRYLSAETRAAAVPASSVAITPANYKFNYKGAVKTGGAIAYSFVITPRKKRAGLMRGELWLDGETGAVVRQSGYLVRNPSIFVKRIFITRETVIRDGLAKERVTYLSVDTRLVGRAELIIHEHPCTDPGGGSSTGIEEW